jgi:hypothetical protein
MTLPGYSSAERRYFAMRRKGWTPEQIESDLGIKGVARLEERYERFERKHIRKTERIERKLRFIGHAEGRDHYAVYSFTRDGKDVKHHLSIDPVFGDVDCECEAFRYAPSAAKSSYNIYSSAPGCKHLERAQSRYFDIKTGEKKTK